MILEAIFNGQIYPAETVVPKCKKFRDAGEAVANIMAYFEQKLSKEDYDKLEKLNDHLADRQCLQTEEHFKFGFAMGVLLMKEIYGNTAQKKVPYIAKCDIINLWINR